MRMLAVPAREVMPGLVIRGTLAHMVESVAVSARLGCHVVDITARVPHVSTGEWGSIAMREHGYPGEGPRDVVMRALRRLWQHEWDEALVVDGVEVGRPHG